MLDCMVYSFKTDLLQVLDLGVEEGRLVVAVAGLAQQMEEDSTFAQEELARLKVTNENTASSHVTSVLISDWLQGENDWLREELEEAERRLEEVLATVAGLEVEQQQRVFLQEVSCSLSWAVTLYLYPDTAVHRGQVMQYGAAEANANACIGLCSNIGQMLGQYIAESFTNSILIFGHPPVFADQAGRAGGGCEARGPVQDPRGLVPRGGGEEDQPRAEQGPVLTSSLLLGQDGAGEVHVPHPGLLQPLLLHGEDCRHLLRILCTMCTSMTKLKNTSIKCITVPHPQDTEVPTRDGRGRTQLRPVSVCISGVSSLGGGATPGGGTSLGGGTAMASR